VKNPRPLPAIHRVFPGVFYGWVVASGCALLAFSAVGIGFYSQSVLLDGLVAQRGWPLAKVSAASSLFFIAAGVFGPPIGVFIDRYGARGSIFAGLACMAVALVSIGQVSSPTGLYPAYILFALGFALAGGIPNSAIVTRWFVVQRARATTISQTGVSLGGVVLVPLIALAIAREGIEFATWALVAILLGLGLPVTIWVLRSDPAPFGLEPDGDARAAEGRGLLDPARQYRVWGQREALRTPAFLWLSAAFGAVLFSQIGLLIHALAFFRERLDVGLAGFAFSLLPGASVFGRLVIGGWFADRVDKARLCTALFCVQAAGMFAFAFAPNGYLLVAAAILFGLTIGNIFMMQSLLVADLFGIPSFGRVYSLVQLVTQIAAGLGPLAVGLLKGALGGYANTWLLLAFLSLFGAFALTRVRAPALAD